MDDDLSRFVRGRLRALKEEQAQVEERLVTGLHTTLEGYREAVGLRRGLELARIVLLKPFDQERLEEIEARHG